MTLEWIYRKSPEAFKILYEEIFEEVKEAYLGEHQLWRNVYLDECCCNIFFRHMLRLNHPSTSSLLREITCIIESGQCMFLERAVGKENAVVPHIQSGLLSGNPQVIELLKETAWIMLYIYNVYERGNSLLEDMKVDLAVTNLNLAKPPITMCEEKSLKKIILRNRDMPLAVKLKHHLDEKIIGQDTAKKLICTKIQHFMESNGEVREPILLEGPTGCGKTYIFQCLKECEELQELTFFNYCASDITPSGFQGDDLRDVFKRYKRQERRNKESHLDYSQGLGLIFLDEIDNLIGTANYDASGQDVNALIVSQLLTALAGTQEYEDVDTSKILFICAGAFEELENDRKSEKERKRIGFGRCNEEKKFDKREMYNLRTELEKRGVSRQFFGRVNIIHMDRLTRADFLHILLDPKHGILTKKQNLFRKNNMTLAYDNQVVEKLIDNLDKKMGARGLQVALDALIGTCEYDMIEKGFDEMYLHIGMFEGEPPILRDTDSERVINEARESMKKYGSNYILEGRRESIKICVMPSSNKKIPIVIVKDIKKQIYTKFSEWDLAPEIAVRCSVAVYDQRLADDKEKVISLILQWYCYPLRFQRQAKRDAVRRMTEVLLKYAKNKAEE